MPIVTDRIYKGLVSLEKARKASYKRKTGSLTASVILSCRRASWYAIKDLKPDRSHELDPLVLLRFRDGNESHIKIGILLVDCGIKVIGREIDNTCKGIFVRIDYRIQLDGQDYNLEFKTMAPGPFSTFLKYGIAAFPSYFAQCQLMAGSEPVLPSIVLCKNKGTSDYQDELIKLDWEFIDNLARIKEDFDKNLELDIPPERDFSYNSAPCAGCEFRFRCWFSKIRNDVVLEKDLSQNERKVVDKFYQDIQDNYEAYNKYLESDGELKNYIAFLHTKHAVSKIKLEGITSSLIKTSRQDYDMDYIRSLLTREQIDEAIRYKENKFFRTIIG